MSEGLPAKGIIVTFSGLTAKLVDIDGPGYKRESLNNTHQLSGDFMTKKPSPFIEGQPVKLTCLHNGVDNPVTLIRGATGTLSLTMPVPDGLTTGAIHSTDAFMIDWQPKGQRGQLMMTEVTLEVSGTPGFMAAA